MTRVRNNTATFPNEKFYNIEAYERRMNAMRAGEFVPPPDDTYDAEADMKAHQSSLKRPAVESESYLDKDQLQELRRVQRERVEVRESLTISGVVTNCNSIGWQDEAPWDGCQGKHGCADGWPSDRRLIR